MAVKIASLRELQEKGHNIERLPFSIRILLENALRNKDGVQVTDKHVDTLLNWKKEGTEDDVAYKPARVLMQDFTGVPAVVDIASLRSEYVRQGGDGKKINPAIPVDLIIDHSVQVDYFATDYALQKNVEKEYERNSERYQLLKWAQREFDNFTVVPPGMGICHQVNLEYLAKGIVERNGWRFPDTLVGTDSHTPMVNGIGVLGWGVGGIEAEAAMLGQAIYFTCPQVIGLELKGKLPQGCTATDLVLTITRLLRDVGVVGKFVEVFGDGLNHLAVTDRATISNMSPEFGCTVTYFPIDNQTLDYMNRTNRGGAHGEMVKQYCEDNMLWRTGNEKIEYSQVVTLDLATIEPTVSGPKRPQDKILVKDLHGAVANVLDKEFKREYLPFEKRAHHTVDYFENKDKAAKEGNVAVAEEEKHRSVRIKMNNGEYDFGDAYIAIAAITSCTNTSNPAVMVGAGLMAKKAVEKGLRTKAWVKTSLAPGSKVVTRYLERSGLDVDLAAMRFHTVGYGCTSCIGNSGPLPPDIADAIDRANLLTASVLSGNRNFEARVHSQVKMNFLMSPMLVVAYAIVGRVDINLLEDPLAVDQNGQPVYLKDIWPTQAEIQDTISKCMNQNDFKEVYDVIFDGDEHWQALKAPEGKDYKWDDNSTYIHEVPFFQNLSKKPHTLSDIHDAKTLLYLGESVTTDHISPAGAFGVKSAAGEYLINKGVERLDFNSYGSRRGNHEVMMRGTFANVRIKNKIADREGGFSRYLPTGEVSTVFDVAMKYAKDKTPLIVLAGKEYGSGSSRDWAAKGTYLLGVKAVIATSFERIHRSNLVDMGVLPLEFPDGKSAEELGLDGTEKFSITGIENGMTPGKMLDVTATKNDGTKIEFKAKARLDSDIEVDYYQHDGILQYVLRKYLNEL